MDSQVIRPGIGLGNILLGSKEQSVRSLLGQPSSVQNSSYPDGDSSRDMEYDDLMLSLVFYESDSFRLSTITTSDEKSVFNGINIVGMSESQLVQCDFNGVGAPQFDDDFEEFGKDYCWDSLNMSCWLVNSIVTSVTIMPNFDETGDIPLWPDNHQ